MNKFEEVLERIEKNLEIKNRLTNEDYYTIVFSLKIVSIYSKLISYVEPNNVKCKDCEYLMFSDWYGECSKGFKGIVSPNDSCGKGKKKGGIE